MKPPAFIVLVFALAGSGPMEAADATSPVDATQRNTRFIPAEPVAPEKQTPADRAASSLQERRFDAPVRDRVLAPQAGQRAALDVQETREKQIREKDSRRPEVVEQPRSRFDQRLAPFTTGTDTTKPPTVTRYQESLSAASAANMARFPALEGATSAKINRFVFRKNPPDSGAAMDDARVTPAAGGSPIRK